MRQSFYGRHIGRDLMIPLYILSAQTRNSKITTHTTYYIIPLPFLQARELKNNFSISFQLRVSFFFSFFSRTLCTAVPVSLIIIPPCSSGNKVVFEPAQSDTVFIRRHMSHLYEGKGTRQSKQASSPPV